MVPPTLLFSMPFTQSEFHDEKDLHGIEHRVRTNHCSNRSLVQAFSGSLCLWLHYELLPASLSWPLLPSLGALLTMPLANSPEASCVLSLSFKDLYAKFSYPEKLFHFSLSKSYRPALTSQFQCSFLREVFPRSQS